jgi:hypothetical protein
MAVTTRTKHSEVLVLGSGLNGLLAAEAYRQMGRSVVILEGLDRLGATDKPMLTASGHLPPHLGFCPSSPNAKFLLNWLSQLLKFDLTMKDVEMGPIHYDGHFKSFLGFGEKALASRDEVDFYCQPFRIESDVQFPQLTLQLIESLTPFAQTRKQVTQLFVQGDRVVEVEINGEERWTADTIIATQSPSEILDLIPADQLDGKLRSRLAKAAGWGAVSLHLLHKNTISQEKAMHILYGSGQEAEPVVGQFWPAKENGQQISMWMTFVSAESRENTEDLSHAVKHIKRQLKRAYPDLLESILEDRLMVQSDLHGYVDLKSKCPAQLPGIQNLFINHPMIATHRGPMACIEAAFYSANPNVHLQNLSLAASNSAPEAGAEALQI